MTEPSGRRSSRFIPTREHRRFVEFANAVRNHRYIGLCYGPAGVGKTLSARRYANWDLAEPLLERIELVIIDEVERLKYAAIEHLRDLFDRNDIGLIFIGMPGIEKRMSYFPQLYSRVGFAHQYPPLQSDEVIFVLQRHCKRLGVTLDVDDFTDAQAIAAIVRITGGNFRLLHRLLVQTERILRINELVGLSEDVVEAARETLIIGAN